MTWHYVQAPFNLFVSLPQKLNIIANYKVGITSGFVLLWLTCCLCVQYKFDEGIFSCVWQTAFFI